MGYIDDIMGAMKGDNLAVRNDDSSIDRVSYRWTCILCLVFAFLVTVETYFVDDIINCWVPAEFQGAWEAYTDNYCWIRNTYYLPFDKNIPREIGERQRDTIVYYQWVPLFMLIQAGFFFAPILVWRSFNYRTGIDVNDIVETAEKVEQANDDDRKSSLTLLTNQLSIYLNIARNRPHQKASKAAACTRKLCFCCVGSGFDNYMTSLYLFTKLLFIANAVAQLFILNVFLGNDFSLYGVKLIKGWTSGERVEDSPYFPKVTLCDVQTRRVGNIHRYTVQCVLTMNLFNEKIYTFLWFWILAVALMSTYDFIMWSLRLLIPIDQRRYIQKRLRDAIKTSTKLYQGEDNQRGKTKEEETIKDPSTKNVERFTGSYLKADGMLVLRLVDYNTNKLTMEDITLELWKDYWAKKDGNANQADDTNDDDDTPALPPNTPPSAPFLPPTTYGLGGGQ